LAAITGSLNICYIICTIQQHYHKQQIKDTDIPKQKASENHKLQILASAVQADNGDVSGFVWDNNKIIW